MYYVDWGRKWGGFIAFGCLCALACSTIASQHEVDGGFQSPNEAVKSIALLPDGSVLYGSQSNTVSSLRRLYPDGSPASGFDGTDLLRAPTLALAVEPDGSTLQAKGVRNGSLQRVVAPGSNANAFNLFVNGPVHAVAVIPDGRILVGGISLHWVDRREAGSPGCCPMARSIHHLPGRQTERCFRWLSGRTGASWLVGPLPRLAALPASDWLGCNPTVESMVVFMWRWMDRSIAWHCSRMEELCWADIFPMWEVSQERGLRGFIRRVKSIRALPWEPIAGSIVWPWTSKGNLYVGGDFNALGSMVRPHLARVRLDGSLDLDFNPAPDGPVAALAVEPGGNVLVGGSFTNISGSHQPGLARLLTAGGGRDELIGSGPGVLQWRRAMKGVEVTRTFFETSEDGLIWTPLGEGYRIPDGWEWSGATPVRAYSRVRGPVAGDGQGQWEARRQQGPPMILSQPESRTSDAGAVVSFHVLAAGSEELRYRWFKDGSELGVVESRLRLEYVLAPDEGDYHVVVENESGSVTSEVASLNVIDPIISMEPVDVAVSPGQSTGLEVQAKGSAPHGFQWFHDDVPVPNATSSILPLDPVVGEDAGFYRAEVTNAFGSVTSQIAEVAVNTTEIFPGVQP